MIFILCYIFNVVIVVQILMKGRYVMHHNTLTDDKKSFITKVIFFLILLSIIALIYLESGVLKDLVYFAIVFILFIKFLIIKLYH